MTKLSWFGRLALAWMVSCVASWLIWKLLLGFSPLPAYFDRVAASKRFDLYTNIEFIGNVLQGLIFFAIVGAESLRSLVKSMDQHYD